LGTHPQLEVLNTIVVSDAVPMMHAFVETEMPSQERLHYQDVLEDVPGGSRPRVSWEPDH